jgi:hypothetical protein
MDRSKEDDRNEKGLSVDYICQSLYCPRFGTRSSCEERESVGDEIEILS